MIRTAPLPPKRHVQLVASFQLTRTGEACPPTVTVCRPARWICRDNRLRSRRDVQSGRQMYHLADTPIELGRIPGVRTRGDIERWQVGYNQTHWGVLT
jgi:hypothetical protein